MASGGEDPTQHLYSRLPKYAIRLLKLDPGTELSPLACTLIPVSLAYLMPSSVIEAIFDHPVNSSACVEKEEIWLPDAPSYEAVSYAWGNYTELKIYIDCDGRSLLMTENLNAALRRLRYPERHRILWIDAICINQADILERNSQVELMAMIYKNAKQVLVCLGMDQVNTEGTAALISEIVSSSRGQDLEAIEPDQWNRVEAIFRCPWWQRVWVVQEIGLATEATFLYGNSECPVNHMIVAAASIIKDPPQGWLKSLPDGTAFPPPSIVAAYKLLITYPRIGFPRCTSFLEVMENTRHSLASNPLDKIFALLGHPKALHKERPIVRVDYQMRLQELYIELAAKLLLQDPQFFLSSVYHSDLDQSGNMALPTWVPEWHLVSPCFPLGGKRRGPRFSAAGSGYGATLDILHYGFIVSADQKTIQTEGFVLDDIYDYSKILSKADFSPVNDVACNPVLQIISCNGDLSGSSAKVPQEISDTWSFETLSYVLISGLIGINVNNWMAVYSSQDDRKAMTERFAASMLKIFGTLPDSRVDAFAHAVKALGLSLESVTRFNLERYMLDASNACNGRRVFATTSGYWGLGPSAMKKGDICCITAANVPMIMRPHGGEFKLVGEAYVHGMMFGEAVDGVVRGDFLTRDFRIC
ncbi:hypothetical protein BP5796_01195 [Coleophoma crateriformis]|uniref:Heterokaryon incompatibility domain-containing protein n=1 Tax=Coleophoma crateriformis TaxID=565419 RepID=A0A3D8T048_9HELO|nr:hypothetical protein BP5796_01195 [Coleophoma crateriformis]